MIIHEIGGRDDEPIPELVRVPIPERLAVGPPTPDQAAVQAIIDNHKRSIGDQGPLIGRVPGGPFVTEF